MHLGGSIERPRLLLTASALAVVLATVVFWRPHSEPVAAEPAAMQQREEPLPAPQPEVDPEPAQPPIPPPPPQDTGVAEPEPAEPITEPLVEEFVEAVEPEAPAPLPTWPQDWPPALQPAAFEGAADQAFSDCPADPGYAYLGVDCEEAPCLLLFAVERDEDGVPGDWEAGRRVANECPPWPETHPTEIQRLTRCSQSVQCEDGEVWLLAIAPNAALEFGTGPVGLDEEDFKAQLQRRCSAARALACP